MANRKQKQLLLVTGATGFIGSHCVVQALKRGLRVRAAVHSINDRSKVGFLHNLKTDVGDMLEIVPFDMEDETAVLSALQGVTDVVHTALNWMGRTDAQMVCHGSQGMQNVLEASAKEGVRSFVLTSSCAATYPGEDMQNDGPFNESDWSQHTSPNKFVYNHTKVTTEKQAYSFVEQLPESSRFRLVSICPSLVMGPVLTDTVPSSAKFIQAMLDSKLCMQPAMNWSICDVRDVAAAHLNAIDGEHFQGRFIVSHQRLWMQEMAQILAKAYPERGVPTCQFPSWLLRLLIPFSKGFSPDILKMKLDRMAKFDGSKTLTTGLLPSYTPAEESILLTAQSLVAGGHLLEDPHLFRRRASIALGLGASIGGIALFFWRRHRR